MASTIRVNTIEPYSGSSVTIDADIIVNGDKTVDGNLIVTGSVQVPRLFASGDEITLGTDATGTNVAATNFTQDGPLSTGTGTPAALVWRVGVQGSTGTSPQTPTEAFRVQEIANNGSRELSLTVADTLNVGAASTVSVVLRQTIDSIRALDSIRVFREANLASLFLTRVNGTLASPTAIINNDTISAIRSQGFSDSSTLSEGARVLVTARENWTPSALGSQLNLQAVDTGNTTIKTIVFVRGGGTNIAELVSGQSTLRLIPGATQFAIRDSGNTADTFTINAAGTTVTIPLATTITAAASALSIGLGAVINETGADSDTRIEGDTDANLVFVDAGLDAVAVGTNSVAASAKFEVSSTTKGFLPPRMTTTQRDNIASPAAGLIIWNTTTTALNVYNGAAWRVIADGP